jgi:hypothetical protein
MIYPTAVDFPRLTISEESNLILQEIFEYDSEGMETVLNDFCEENGIAYDWDANGEEIDNLIVDNEDELSLMYQNYQTSDEIVETEKVLPMTVEDEEFAF